MIELLLLSIIILLAKRRRGRRYRRYIRGNIDEKMSLGTLAGNTLVAQAFAESVEEKTFVSSIDVAWALLGLNPAVGDGPIVVGVSHSDYTAAEIEGFIENTGSWSEGDMITQREIGRRLIKIVGIFHNDTATTTEVLNDGRKLRTKLNWVLTTGDTLDLWAYNSGSSALDTTVAQLHINGHANLWPM